MIKGRKNAIISPVNSVSCFCFIATGFGDPHMITLDGVEYTFNGYGEYQILNVAGPDFELQGRMQPLVNDDGSNTRATVYKAFAMKENGSDVVQVKKIVIFSENLKLYSFSLYCYCS